MVISAVRNNGTATDITVPDNSDDYKIGEVLESIVHDDIFNKTPAEYVIRKNGTHFTTLKVVKKPNGMLVIEA